MTEYLEETFFYNFSDPAIEDFTKSAQEHKDRKAKAIALYLKVRDGWRYDPYTFNTRREDFKASVIFQRSSGHCLDKSILLIACLRSVGIPARIHLAKVKNHIGVERIIEKLGTDELAPHGFVEVFLNEKWIACTPAFNQELCQKLGVDVLEFDGENDSIFQAYSQDGSQFMEYLEDYGTFADYPYEFAGQKLLETYPT